MLQTLIHNFASFFDVNGKPQILLELKGLDLVFKSFVCNTDALKISDLVTILGFSSTLRRGYKLANLHVSMAMEGKWHLQSFLFSPACDAARNGSS